MPNQVNLSDLENEIYSYHLTLVSDADGMRELWIPKIPEGYFRFSNETRHRFLSIYAKDGRWVAACQKPGYFTNTSIEHGYETPLADGKLLKIAIEERNYSLLIEQVIPHRKIFHRHQFQRDMKIVLGSSPDCDICYRGPFVAEKHAELIRTNGQWQIKNLDDEYGIYINKEKCDEAELKLGDVIFIMGLKIIVGQNFLSMNNGLGEISVNPQALQETTDAYAGYFHYYSEEFEKGGDKFFNRMPRKRREREQKVITVEGPPMSMTQKQMPLMLRLGSSMVMGGAAAMAGNFMTLITSVMFPFLSTKYTDAQRKEYEQLRNTKYTEYLEKKRREIMEAIDIEQRELNAKYPPLKQVVNIGKSEHLWERRPSDSDFLQLRLGTGSRPLETVIDYPVRRFALETDELEEKMYRLVETPYKVQNAPIVLSLMDAYVCGIEGERENILSMIRSLVMQTAVHHSYDEVKMVFLLQQEELQQLDSIRYLPHVWDDMRINRFVATSEAEAYAVGEYIKDQLADETKEKKDIPKILKKRPYYIVFALDKKLFDGHEVFKQFLQEDQNPGVSVITAYEGLPKECQKIISLQGAVNNTCTTMGVDGGEDEIFSVEKAELEDFHKIMHLLANTSLKQVDKAQTMPKMVTFLEMFHVGRVEQLNPLKRWRENNPVKSLAAPVGVGEDGSLFMLDLHEKRQGPHGLVAGMTGSGKSEFLISYILSMAVNYHPDEVSFVLIDYKGGGLADAFENPRTGVKLPHLAGTITNLDGASIQRSLMSIESELVRRQKVFSEVSKDFDEGSMNIYTYQKLYRAGKVSEPMPHLFIVSDEFAELKQQQPEFMDKLISAARIGRSLGIHLILATQKPSGVVNDQIRSNTKFRVCLRVQDRSDSQDMLKRPEAAELTDTGRFYLQVGYNEYFALGQSAWCGADYEPQDTVPVQRDDAVEFLDMTGQVVIKNKPKVKKTRSGITQIGAVVKYLSDLATKEKTIAKRLWLDPLPLNVTLDDIRTKYNESPVNHVRALLGEIDDPMHQQKYPLYVDVQHTNNLLIVGESGSGKTTLLQTFLYELTTHYSSAKLQYYLLDFSSRNLKLFAGAPHCGGFITDENEDRIQRFFELIRSIVDERRQKFAQAEVSNYDAYIEIEDLPLILVVIDDVLRIEEMRARSDFYGALEDLMSNGVSYGVKVVFTVGQINSCPMRLRRNAGIKLALRVKDRFAYSDVLDKKCLYEPDHNSGRGMCAVGDGCYEFQTALATPADSEATRASQIRENLKRNSQKIENFCRARQIEELDDNLSYEAFCGYFPLERLPLGFHLDTLQKVAIPLQQLKNISIYFGNAAGVEPVIRNLLYAFEREQATFIALKRNENSSLLQLQDNLPKGSTVFECTQDGVQELLQLLTEQIHYRKQFRDLFCAENNICNCNEASAIQLWRKYLRTQTKPIFVFLESLVELATQIEVETAGELSAFLQMCHGYNIYFIDCTYPDDEKVLERAKYPNGEENASEDEDSAEYIRRKELRHIWEGLCGVLGLDRFCLLFGGRYNLQQIAALPVHFQNIKNPYNIQEIERFVMQYRGQIYKMSMPCDKQSDIPEDSDELNII